jgi:hypothetical protein
MEPRQMTRTPNITRHEVAAERLACVFIFGGIANHPAIIKGSFYQNNDAAKFAFSDST